MSMCRISHVLEGGGTADCVNRSLGDKNGGLLLDVSLFELHVRLAVSEGLDVVILMTLSTLELFVCHINTNHAARLTHQLAHEITVTPRATTEVQDGHALEDLGEDETTSIVALEDFL